MRISKNESEIVRSKIRNENDEETKILDNKETDVVIIDTKPKDREKIRLSEMQPQIGDSMEVLECVFGWYSVENENGRYMESKDVIHALKAW